MSITDISNAEAAQLFERLQGAQVEVANRRTITQQQQVAMVMPALTPAAALEEFGPASKRLYFPQPVRLALNDRRMISWPKGFHDVPLALADHPYLVASRVRELPPATEAVLAAVKEILREEESELCVGYRMQPGKG